MNKFFQRLINLIYPDIPSCVYCGRESDESVCPRCFKAILPLALTGPQDIYACYRYDGPIKNLIQRYKFGGQKWLSSYISQCMAQRVSKGDFDLVTFTPLHKKRLRQRGFHQSWQLAQCIADRLNLPCIPTLQKVKHTVPQSKLSAQQRKQNLSGAFAIISEADLAGRRVLLIDDVCTTGTTLSECTRVLLSAGAAHVRAAVFALA